MIFTEPAAAIEEASQLAADNGKPYSLVDIDGDRIMVLPAEAVDRENHRVLETCN